MGYRPPEALAAAFDAPAPDVDRVALVDAQAPPRARRPRSLTVDDAHWLDRPTVDVLALLARRIAGRADHAAVRR